MVKYDFYVNTYRGGSIPAQEFDFFAARASEQLAQYKRMYSVESQEADSEQMAMCAMADVIYAITATQNGSGAVTSASIGSVSVSYGAAASVDLSHKGQARELYAAACRYLDIYRG